MALSALDPEFRACPHRIIRDIAAEGRCIADPPFHRFLITGFAEARAFLLRNDVSADPQVLDKGGAAVSGPFSRTMLQTDPPDHGKLRGLVGKRFAAAALEAHRPAIAAEAERLLDRVAGAAGFDLLGQFAIPLALSTMVSMLGTGQTPAMAQWILDLEPAFDPFADAAARARLANARDCLRAFYLPLCRADGPQDDPLADMTRTAIAAGLTTEAVVETATLLLGAGTMTTADLITNGVYRLLSEPGQLSLLRSDPALLKGAIEETLRLEPSVAQYARISLAEARIGETIVPAGTGVSVSAFATGMDPTIHPDPERFDITREQRAHLAFAAGIHACIGSHLARMEAGIAWAALFRRFPALRIDPAEIPQRRPSLVFNGFERLLVLP
ncbi:cytochrome P450 [Acidisoma sp. C75]